jgi:hypothetical protein
MDDGAPIEICGFPGLKIQTWGTLGLWLVEESRTLRVEGCGFPDPFVIGAIGGAFE